MSASPLGLNLLPIFAHQPHAVDHERDNASTCIQNQKQKPTTITEELPTQSQTTKSMTQNKNKNKDTNESPDTGSVSPVPSPAHHILSNAKLATASHAGLQNMLAKQLSQTSNNKISQQLQQQQEQQQSQNIMFNLGVSNDQLLSHSFASSSSSSTPSTVTPSMQSQQSQIMNNLYLSGKHVNSSSRPNNVLTQHQQLQQLQQQQQHQFEMNQQQSAMALQAAALHGQSSHGMPNYHPMMHHPAYQTHMTAYHQQAILRQQQQVQQLQQLQQHQNQHQNQNQHQHQQQYRRKQLQQMQQQQQQHSMMLSNAGYNGTNNTRTSLTLQKTINGSYNNRQRLKNDPYNMGPSAGVSAYEYKHIVSPVSAITRQVLRKGKWTLEEKEYTQRLMDAFRDGELPSRFGVRSTHTLRTFVAKWLHCDAMRITKKFVGSDATGKKVYQQNIEASVQRLTHTENEINELEIIFLEKLRMLQSVRDQKDRQALQRKRKAEQNYKRGRNKISTSTWRQAQERREAFEEQARNMRLASSVLGNLTGMNTPPTTYHSMHPMQIQSFQNLPTKTESIQSTKQPSQNVNKQQQQQQQQQQQPQQQPQQPQQRQLLQQQHYQQLQRQQLQQQQLQQYQLQQLQFQQQQQQLVKPDVAPNLKDIHSIHVLPSNQPIPPTQPSPRSPPIQPIQPIQPILSNQPSQPTDSINVNVVKSAKVAVDAAALILHFTSKSDSSEDEADL